MAGDPGVSAAGDPAAASGRGRRAAWLGAYAAATFLAFPHPVGGRVLDLGVAFAWLAPACLVAGLAGLAPRRALGWGFAGGLAAHAGVLHWLWVVTVVYGHAPAIAGVAAPLLLGSYVAAHTALFAAGLAWLSRLGQAGPFAVAALWTATEHLRAFSLTGFPWATLGYAQHANAALVPLAAYTGVYGLSFLSALGGAALVAVAAALRARRRPGPQAVAALATVALAHPLGAWVGARVPPDGGESVRVAVLQGNIDQGVKWSPAFAEETLAIYEDLSREAARLGARLVVWPETAMPGALDADPGLRARLAGLAAETDAAFVVGVVGLERAADDEVLYFDSAYALSPTGELLERYDKSHLVPFGEYIPFRGLLGQFLGAVARGIASADVSAGPGPRSVGLPLSGKAGPDSSASAAGAPGGPGARPAPAAGRLRVGVAICYELIFPDLVRRFVRDGAELLLGITNDAWYGRTGAPYQFLAITALRSAENRVWTARAANTGVSAIIDARGRVQAATRIFERDLLVADVPLRPPPVGGSFYARHGDVFAGACWLGVGLAALAGAAGRRAARAVDGGERGGRRAEGGRDRRPGRAGEIT